jgi:phage terminase large subunit GpA-like protein
MPTALLPETPLSIDPTSLEAWEDDLEGMFNTIFRPRPHLSMSEWADTHRYLARGTGHESGRWRTSRVPYLREIMDAVSDTDVTEMVIMKSARIGYTEGIIGNAIGYFVHQDPSPILIIQPTEGDGRNWSQKQLAPMIHDTPVLCDLVQEARARESGNTILDKTYPGGSITIRGAHSPKGLRRHTARVIAFDEIDGMESAAGKEGDPILLGERAAKTFPNRKIIKGSTPTIKDASRIETDYLRSDQRRYHVECPHCEESQVLEWGGPDKDYGIKWDQEVFCKGCGVTLEGDPAHCPDCLKAEFEHRALPDTAYYECRHCHEPIAEHHKLRMVEAGVWIAQNPRAPIPGWHINALISLFDGARWPVLVQEFLTVKNDPPRLQVWVNQTLGETFVERFTDFEPEGLAKLAEVYGAEVPHGVGLLTAGIDKQHDRLEIVVRGWGAGYESWLITHERIHGDTTTPGSDVWKVLERFLTKGWQHESGAKLRIHAAFVDAGDEPDVVDKFTAPRQRRRVYSAMGVDSRQKLALKRSDRKNKNGVRRWTVDSVHFKDILMKRLRMTSNARETGPGYYHFCGPTGTGADAEFFAQFGAEIKRRTLKGGQYTWGWHQIRDRNESIDCEYNALAALHTLNQPVLDALGELADQASEGKVPSLGPSKKSARRGRVRSKGVES